MLPQGAVLEALSLKDAAACQTGQPGDDDTVPRCCTPAHRLVASLQLQLARVELQLGQEDLVGRSAGDPKKTRSFPTIPGRDASPVVKYLESIELSQQPQAGQVKLPTAAPPGAGWFAAATVLKAATVGSGCAVCLVPCLVQLSYGFCYNVLAVLGRL